MPAIERQAELFDYDALTLTTRDIVQRRTGEIQDLMRRTAADIVDIGLKLTEIKGILGHGNFGVWITSEFGWSYETANKFVQVAGAFKSVNFTDLDIAPSALYALASPSIPEPIRQDFIQRAEAGEKVTHNAVKNRIKSHQEKLAPARADVTANAQSIHQDPINAPIFAGPEVQKLIQIDSNYVIEKNETEQDLAEGNYDEATKLENHLAKAIRALSALSTYTPAELSRISRSGGGQLLQVQARLIRVQQLCGEIQRLHGKEDMIIDA